MEVNPEGLAGFFEAVLPHLNERQRRVLAGAAAQLLGNKTVVAEAAGMSRNTVIKAEVEVEAGMETEQRQRPPGAGQKPITETQPGILEDLDRLVHPDIRGATRRLCCAGPRSRPPSWPRSWYARGTRSRPTASAGSSNASATRCKPPPSKKRAPATPTVTASSVT